MNLVRCPRYQYLCCDIIARLSNDVQGLIQELEHLKKLQSSYYSLQEQLNLLLDELDVKLSAIVYLKEPTKNNGLTLQKINDFVTFVRLAWLNIQQRLENRWSKESFLSILDGCPLVPTLMDIVNFITEVSAKFGASFVHVECTALFNELSYQVNYVTYPELAHADDFIRWLSYAADAVPCLINLITIVELYGHTPKYDTVGSLCQEVVDGTPLDTSVPVQEIRKLLPVDCLLHHLREGQEELEERRRFVTLPVVEHSTPKMPEYVHRMSAYLMDMSVAAIPERTRTFFFKPQSFQYRCTDQSYAYVQVLNASYGGGNLSVFTEMGLSPGQVQYMLQLQHHHQGQTAGRRSRKRASSDDDQESAATLRYLAKTASGSSTDDLQPIKVPRLSYSLLKPFCY